MSKKRNKKDKVEVNTGLILYCNVRSRMRTAQVLECAFSIQCSHWTVPTWFQRMSSQLENGLFVRNVKAVQIWLILPQALSFTALL